MNVLGISGSPRKNSNSGILLDAALAPFVKRGWRIVSLRLCDLAVQSCAGCESCQESGFCVLKDDMELAYDSFRECNALIVASPIYYRNLSSRLLAVFERYHAVHKKGYLAGKPGGAITVGRGAGGGQAIGLDMIYNWMRSCGMFGVAGELNGVSAVADKPGEIGDQPKRLRQAEILGENVLAIATRLFYPA